MSLNWSNGTYCERSTRTTNNKITIGEISIDKQPDTVIKECLDNNFMFDKITQSVFSRNINELNRKEFSFNKMNEREIIPQKSLNPFSQNNYLNDIDISNKFLISQNTTIEK
jgi:hypothetical protein